MMVKLYAPKEYWQRTPEELDEITGGCGPGGTGDYFVPDTIWGLNIKPCCRIHDFCYYIGETHADKETADRIFLYNMLRIVEAKTKNWLLKKLRKRRARIYYLAVSYFGGPAFWHDKNSEDEFQEVGIWR